MKSRMGCVTAMRANNAFLMVEHRESVLRGGDVLRCVWSHPRIIFLYMEFAAACAAGVLPVLDAECLDRHHWAIHDRRAVTAARHLTRAVLGPKGVDDLRAFVAVILALVARDGQRVEIGGHHLLGRQVRPGPLSALRAVAVVIRHDLRLDLSLDVGEQLFHLLQIDIPRFLSLA